MRLNLNDRTAEKVAELVATTDMKNKEAVKNAILVILDECTGAPVGEPMKALLLKGSYFEDPASTRFHLSRKGGLALHSLLVLASLLRLQECFKYLPKVDEITPESMIKVAILHDMCKVGTYKVESRNRKNDTTGQWEKYDVFVKVSAGPGTNYGHGFGSLMIAMEAGLTFTPFEKEAIIHHMGAFGETKDVGMNDAFGTNPLAFLLHQADMTATHLVETDIE